MKKLTALTLLVFSFSLLFAQTQGIKWQRPLGGTSGDASKATLAAADGNILTAVETFSNNGDISGAHGLTDTWISKLTPDGQTLWSKAVGSTGQDYFLNLHTTPDGGAILLVDPGAGNGDITSFKGSRDVFVMKFSAIGQVEWKRSIGGSSSDNYVGSYVKLDGSLLIVGNTFSVDGDFTSNHGSSDIFFCKLDAAGNMVFSLAYGGANSESVHSIVEKTNGDYLLFGRTLSNNSGQVGPTKGGTDLLLLQVSSTGAFLGSKTYGGTGNENPKGMVQVGASKFALVAETNSLNGDMIGAKGASDLWVGMVNETGTTLHQQVLGGSSFETPLHALSSPTDSSLIVVSTTSSSDGDITNYHGGNDLWFVKLNNQGTVQWKTCLGGAGDESYVTSRLEEGLLYFVGNTTSSNGDVSGHHGKSDLWTGMLSETGLLVWQRCLGGSEDDFAKAVVFDGTRFLIGGDVSSKDGDVTGMHYKSDTLVQDTLTTIQYATDAWVVSLSRSGAINWQKALGGFASEQLHRLVLLNGELYLGATTGSTNGDVFKNHGASDAWLVRLGAINTIKGSVFIDANSNGVFDVGEKLSSDVVVTSKRYLDSVSSIPYGGVFTHEVDTGSYETTLRVNSPYYTVVPSFRQSNFFTYFNQDSFSFALQPIAAKQDLRIHLIPLVPPRPGFEVSYRLLYQNVGTTTITSGVITLAKDSRLSLLSAFPGVSSAVGDTLKWNYANFSPGDTASILINFRLATPPSVGLGDTLKFLAFIDPVLGDETPADDTARLKQIVIGSFDPNDKVESNAGLITPSFIANGSALQYTIRFQNTGSDVAFGVNVRDTLDSRVDPSTLEIVSVSHPYQLRIENERELSWDFSNIMLPDSTTNEPGSHGYIVYRIRLKADVVAGETIHNTASIYFDFNLPVVTNDAETRVEAPLVILPQGLLHFWGTREEETAVLNWKVVDGNPYKLYEVERSTDGNSYIAAGGHPGRQNQTAYTFQDNILAFAGRPLYYRLKMIDESGKVSYSGVLHFSAKKSKVDLEVYPNPVSASSVVSFTNERSGAVELQIISAGGSVLKRTSLQLSAGRHTMPIMGTERLPKGLYFIRLVSDEGSATKPITIQ